ncbi:MAG: bifunctional diaminohydroxyphosphoribosylaminopyrimidine deaminase/5-amino-6-(5-phosphoribosylamino)uracil reductase RibD [Verrucomicrobiota bacterium]
MNTRQQGCTIRNYKLRWMQAALRLALRGYGTTSPNPMVGAVLVKGGKIIGCGWHRRAGEPHAEIEAIRDMQNRGQNAKSATLYVTLEPCCTQGRTPPCTEAIIAAGIKKIVIGATDPNPKHSGKAFKILRRAGIEVVCGVLAGECAKLNEAFNHWIVHHTPFVTVKAAMTLDGKIATASGESKWITGQKARTFGMKLRQGADAILVGLNTILADDASLTIRGLAFGIHGSKPRRIILDSMARTPLAAKIASDEHAALTTIVVGRHAPKNRVAALAKRVKILVAPLVKSQINLSWLLKKLGAENAMSLLVEGGGEVNASFLLGGFAQRVVFFYAPKILSGRDSHKAVAGEGVKKLSEAIQLREIEWKRIGKDLLMTARI